MKDFPGTGSQELLPAGCSPQDAAWGTGTRPVLMVGDLSPKTSHVPSSPPAQQRCGHGTQVQGVRYCQKHQKHNRCLSLYFCAKENRNFGEILKRHCEMPNHCCAWAREIPPPVPTQQHRGARRQQKLRHELHGWGWAAPCGATRCRAVPPCDDTRCRAVPPGATWCHPAGPNASSDSASPWAHGQGQVALVGHETWAPAGTKIISGAACPHRANSLLPMLCPWEQSQHRQEGTVTSPALVPPRCPQCKPPCAHTGA